MPSATRSDATPPSSSFRDPAAHLTRHEGRLLLPLLDTRLFLPEWVQNREPAVPIGRARRMNPEQTRLGSASRLRGFDVARPATFPRSSRTMDLTRRRA